MRKVKLYLFLAAFVALFFTFNFHTFDVSASEMYYIEDDEMAPIDWLVTGVTENSVSVDVSKLKTKTLTELKYTYGGNFDSLNVSVAIEEISSNDYNGKNLSYVDMKNKTKHTFSKLKSKTGYRVYIKYDYTYKLDGKRISKSFYDYTNMSTDGFDELSLYTKGVTDTTATLDWRRTLKSVKNESDNGEFGSFSIGYAKVGSWKNNKEKTAAENKAVKAAKEMAWRHEITTPDKSRMFAITDLEPDSTYVACLLFKASVVLDKKRISCISYAITREIKTTKKSGIGKQSEDSCRKRDINAPLYTDAAYKYNDFASNYSNYFYDIKKNGKSVTLSWKDHNNTIVPSDNTFSVGYAKETVYDPLDIVSKNKDPMGDDLKQAYSMAKSGKIKINGKTTEYTLQGLDPNAYYTIVLKIGTPDYYGSVKTYYAVSQHVCPAEDKNEENIWDDLNNIQQGYMYDFQVKKDGKDAIIDWSGAVSAFISQKGLDHYLIKYDEMGSAALYVTNKSVLGNGTDDDKFYTYKRIYNNIRRADDTTQYYSMKFDQRRKKTRSYNLNSDQNIYALKLDFVCYSYGGCYRKISTVFFCEDGGENYFRAMKTGGKDPLGFHNLGDKTLYLKKEGVKCDRRDGYAMLNAIYEDDSHAGSKTYAYYDRDEKCYYVDFNSDGKNELKFSETSDNKILINIVDDTSFKGKTIYLRMTDKEIADFESKSDYVSDDYEYFYSKLTVKFPENNLPPKQDKDDNVPGAGNGPSGNSGNESANSGNGKSEGSISGQVSASDKKYVSMKENHAYITIDRDSVKASKVKKKAQKFVIGIENSKGKIKVKNLSPKKLRKYIDFKVKKGKVTVTLKKGAKKGTYKLKVTVGANGNVNKTTETVRIKVK
ncbi:hypothetical protein [Butyrivibrio sp. AE3004]|uniref:hypothetical protein n=1 Tax=Butyrivibrio sp. AE3004 TaxID=1506994 RepID=UPI000494C768|nr:hypothetical protein [Butyrivibrio sp. AE3004]